MTHRFSSFRFSAMLFENESRALGDVNISDFPFFSNPGCSSIKYIRWSSIHIRNKGRISQSIKARINRINCRLLLYLYHRLR
jgi:hypothetical protein